MSAWSSLDSHLALAEGLLSPSTLVSLPDFIHRCSRDVEVFHVAQVLDRVWQEKGGGLLGWPKLLTEKLSSTTLSTNHKHTKRVLSF